MHTHLPHRYTCPPPSYLSLINADCSYLTQKSTRQFRSVIHKITLGCSRGGSTPYQRCTLQALNSSAILPATAAALPDTSMILLPHYHQYTCQLLASYSHSILLPYTAKKNCFCCQLLLLIAP